MFRFLVVVALFVTGFGLICFFGGKREFYVKTYLDRSVTVLCTTNEAFVFTRQRISGLSGSRVAMAFKELREIFVQPEYERSMLCIFHIQNDQLQRHIVESFGEGGPYPVHGIIYYQVPTNEIAWPAVWQWSGTNFFKVGKPEAKSMLASFSSLSELLKSEGWKIQQVVLASGEKSVPIDLLPTTFNLLFKVNTSNGFDTSTILILGNNSKLSGELLVQETSKYTRVDRSTYLRTFGLGK